MGERGASVTLLQPSPPVPKTPTKAKTRYGGGWAGVFALIAFLGAGIAPNEGWRA